MPRLSRRVGEWVGQTDDEGYAWRCDRIIFFVNELTFGGCVEEALIEDKLEGRVF